MKYQDIQHFELEKPLALHDVLLLKDDEQYLEQSSDSSSSSSSSSSSFPMSMMTANEQYRSFCSNGYCKYCNNNGTRVHACARYTLVGLVGLAVVLLMVRSVSPTVPLTPSQPTATSITTSNDSSNSLLFDIQDEDDPRHCVIHQNHKFDVGFMPYSTEMDRSLCETYNSHLRWSQDLRCYRLTTRWCFASLEDGIFSIEEQQLDFHHHGCQIKFYEKDGNMYHYDGRKMPDSFFRNNCKSSSEPESHIWYSVQPKTGCGKAPLRFCREDGSVHWELVHLHKHVGGINALSSYQYNCREFQLIDLIDDGSEDTSQINELCQEQVQGCADRLYRGCDGDGTVNQELISNDEGECLQFDELDSNLAGHETDQGVDLICLDAP